jgi:hypothetical protein
MKSVFTWFSTRTQRATDALRRTDAQHHSDRMPIHAMGGLDHSTSPNDASYWTAKLAAEASFDHSAQLVATATWQRIAHERYAQTNHLAATLPLPVLAAARVGAQLWAARSVPRGKRLHVNTGTKLIATLDIERHQVILSDNLSREDLSNLSASSVPESAQGLSASYIATTRCDVIWQYALHDPTALMELPHEVAYRPLQMRRLPLVMPEFLEPRHRELMRVLLQDKLSFEQLLHCTEIPAHLLCHDVAALVLTRSVYPV